MKYYITNSIEIPNSGNYNYKTISRDEAREWLRANGHIATSYIGYPRITTALHIESLTGLKVPAYRGDEYMLAPGDEALVIKPTYNQSEQKEDWEYGILKCLSIQELLRMADALYQKYFIPGKVLNLE